MAYYFTKTVARSFDETLAKLTDELQKEGFGILTEIWPDPLKPVQMLSYTLDPNSREAGNEEERVHAGTDHHHAEGG